MSVIQEIDSLVKSAASPLDSIKPRSYFFSYRDPVYDHPSTLKYKIQSSGYQPSMVALSQNRQWVPGRPSSGVSMTSQMRIGGSAPIETVAGSSISPFRNWKNWQSNSSTRMMLGASNPNVNTPAVRRQKMMAYMPNAFRSSTSKPVSRQTGVASSSGQKFDFRGEAIKLLKSYGANASRAKGGYSTDIGRNMISQWKDMQANPQNYDEARQRQILDQWRSSIAQMRAGSGQHANPQSIASAPQKQQPVAQTAQKPRGVTTVRRTWSGIPGSAGQPQWAADALAKVENARKKKLLNGLK